MKLREINMRKWNWLRGLRCLVGVGTALAGSLAFAGDEQNIPTIADPDAVFQHTSYDVAQDLGLGGNNCECEGGGLNCGGDPFKLVPEVCGWNIAG